MPLPRASRSVAVLVVLLAAGRAGASDPAGTEFFEKKIRPVLAEHCYQCHSAQPKKLKGGLALDTRDAVRKGGDSGPVLVPGKPDESLLIKAVRYAHDELKMPPKGKLPDAVVADLEAWVKLGAPDPRDTAASYPTAASWDEVLKERRRWWSLQPVRKPDVPAVKDASWSAHPVDRFLLAKLEQAGLKPNGPAGPRTLIRRLSLVLTGLPPTPEEVEAFVSDSVAKPRAAYEALVDRLLSSPHYGERWARHWLDVARYAETHGNEWNYELHHAWRYRDYLTRAFNDDVSFDQLVREQIAGDLLPGPRWSKEGVNESLTGTAFWRFGEVNHDDCIEFRQIGYDLLDNQIDALGKAFQATTIACARCHDHKVDAVSMKDYYAVLGALRSSRQVAHTVDAPEVNAALRDRLRVLKDDVRRALAEQWRAEAKDVGRYLLAAQAGVDKAPAAPQLAEGLDAKRLEAWGNILKAEKSSLEDFIHPWVVTRPSPTQVRERWAKLAEDCAAESKRRAEFNAKHFTTLADFHTGPDGWQVAGQGLRDGPARSGDFALAPDGDLAVRGVYPAGTYTHLLSEKLNGVLRSRVLPTDRKYVSFHVVGNRTSAVRLVSNNCQLNYVNYKALTKDEFEWKRFTISKEADALQMYAELLTKLDNPKYPDQLGTLGGDTKNERVPWEQAIKDPHSYFGITRAVLHDCDETPRDELTHLRVLLAGEVKSREDVAARYADVVAAAVTAWAEGRATDDDARWLDWLLRRRLLSGSLKTSPKIEELVGRYRETERQLALPRVVPGMAEGGAVATQPVLLRGDFRKPGEAAPRRYLEVLGAAPFGPATSGRLELAEQIASPANPLTARVLVNRVWHHLFGAGIVRTVDDFGHVGELPSHPELLDYLAARFVEEGWSVKKLIKSLVMTEAFRQGNMANPQAGRADPRNRLLHHYPARRLEAEAIRDSILAASGRLDRMLFGPSVHPFRDKTNEDRRLFPGPLDGDGRRSLYIKVNLMEPPKFLGVFNFPGGKVTQGRRDVTNVPAQALALLNDPFVLQQAGVWAKRLVARPDPSVSARVEHLFHAALGRPPEGDERDRFERAASRLAELHGVPPAGVMTSEPVWRDLAHAMYNLKEFIYVP